MTTLPKPDEPVWQKPVMFYGKPLVFEPKRHMYFWGGRHVPSVTTIINRLDKPGLVWWAAECACDHVRQKIAGQDVMLWSVDWATILEDARKAHDRIKRAAGDIGTVLHDIAESTQKGTEPSPELMDKLSTEDRLIASNCALALREWLDAQTFGFADLERVIFSQVMMYAGRTDRFGVIGNHLAVLDYKSGGEKVYPETWLQLSGYELALREELGITEPIWHYVVHLNKKTGALTQHVRGPEHTEQAKEAWRRLVAFDAAMRTVPTEAQIAKAA